MNCGNVNSVLGETLSIILKRLSSNVKWYTVTGAVTEITNSEFYLIKQSGKK